MFYEFINRYRKSASLFGIILTVGVAMAAFIAGPGRAYGFAQDIDKLNRFVQTPGQSGAALAVFREGRDLIQQEKWAEAARRFTGFIRKYPRDRNLDAALYWLAYAEVRQSQHREADRRLARLIREFPRSSWVDDARLLRLEIARHTGNDQAITDELDKDEEIKMVALQSLFQINRERAIEVAADILKPNSKSSRRIKEAAVNMLGRYGGDQASAMLGSVARNQSEDEKLREQAIYWIVNRKGEQGVETVIGLYDAEKNPQIKERLMYWLGNSKDARAQAKIDEIALSTDDREVRERAIHWIANRKGEGSFDTLIKLYDAEKDPQIKERLMYWIANSKDARARTRIEEIARTSEDRNARERAIHWIGRYKDEQATNTLIQLYDAQTDEALKERILYSLGRRGTKPALQKLFEIAKNDPSHKLRQRAVHYLGRSKDPEAARLLEQLLINK
ncbi:MAG: HEAT repeat domain-containing protein [Blastocatellia bacterium]|nr:HEAT repeat domain-containing protein [Blastocatellia bacterium]